MLFFAHRLAGTLNCTVKELDSRVSPEEFYEYMAFDQLSPIGGERFDYLAAMLACILANAWSKKKFKMDDFLLKWGRGRGKPRGARTTAEIMKLFQGMPGTVIVKA